MEGPAGMQVAPPVMMRRRRMPGIGSTINTRYCGEWRGDRGMRVS